MTPARLPVLAVLSLLACTTTLTANQRQQLETKVYEASYEQTFRASRDALVNQGYMISESDHEGGVISVEHRIREHNPNTALAWSILVTPVGDFYMRRYAWALVDLLLWPISIAWAAPSNYLIAKRRMKEIDGTLSFESLSSDRTRLRISLRGLQYDTTKYPLQVRALQEEVERQLFMKEGDTLGGVPQ